jgi:hypothetical protein
MSIISNYCGFEKRHVTKWCVGTLLLNSPAERHVEAYRCNTRLEMNAMALDQSSSPPALTT